jgi:hypothetical protein
LKIYSDDPNLPYKTTKLKALYTKSEIDGLFAKWGVKDVYWRWDPEHNDVFVQFKIEEEIDGLLEQIKKSKCKGEAILCAKAIQDVLLQAENVTLKVSC